MEPASHFSKNPSGRGKINNETMGHFISYVFLFCKSSFIVRVLEIKFVRKLKDEITDETMCLC